MPVPGSQDVAGVSPWNVFYYGKSSRGEAYAWCEAEADMSKLPRSAKKVVLGSREGRYYGEVYSHATLAERAEFLAAGPEARAEEMAGWQTPEEIEAASAEIRAEIKVYKQRLVDDAGLSERNVKWWMDDWNKKRLDDEEILRRIKKNYEAQMAKKNAA
jgi:hypothetical protein